MAIPTVPTSTTLVTEAFIRCKIPSPGPAEITRAEDFLLVEVMKIIAQAQNWRVLEETSIAIVSPYVPRYALPADFNKAIEGTLFKTSYSGTAQSGTTSSMKLELGETITEALALGGILIPTDGAAKGEFRRITAYDTVTLIASITPNFTNTPGADGYMIVTSMDDEIDLPYSKTAKLRMYSSPGMPKRIDLYNDELYLDPVPDAGPYAMQIRHQLDIAQIDVTSSRWTLLLTSWEPLLVQGVIALIYQSRDDERYKEAYDIFKELLQLIMLGNEQTSPVTEDDGSGK